MHPTVPFVIAGLLFGIGIYGVLVRRNAVLLLMSVELLLNAVNLVLVTADAAVREAVPRSGQVFALFIIVLAAAETGVGLAVLLQLYRRRGTVAIDTLILGEPDIEPDTEPDIEPTTEPGPNSLPDPDPATGPDSGTDSRPGQEPAEVER